jgi:hypothetical protein
MDLFELSTQSFLIKIWVEETAEEAGETLWRGHITHVHSGERQHFQDLPEVLTFMQPYLTEMGITIGSKRPFQRWFYRWRFSRDLLRRLRAGTAAVEPSSRQKSTPSTEADSLT